MPVDAFWDSSALTSLCITEKTTGATHGLLERFNAIVWWAASVEIHSAIARLHRSGDVTDAEKRIALDRLSQLKRHWQEITPSDEVRDQAQSLLHLYPLRAADILQLAAAMIWCRHKPSGRNFISSDTRLCTAASQAGFVVTGRGTAAC